MDERHTMQLQEAMVSPPGPAVTGSRRRVQKWFAQTAPLIQWDIIDSPLGPLYLATSSRGLCRVDFGVGRAEFLSQLDPLARTEQSPPAVASIAARLRDYFATGRAHFDLPLDLSQVTPFQQSVLQTTRHIPPGTLRTYGQMARTIGKPQASRAVGQALGRNPVPIVVPCHRVVASDGSLGGYSGGGGVESKRMLLALEGALPNLRLF
jgi:methylated-DNA-[protein]-cysteine S-methyltransferase